MISAILFKRILIVFFWLSPYKWIDAILEHLEHRQPPHDRYHHTLRQSRYLLSESYILGWLCIGIAFWVCNAALPVWLVWPALIRVFGILEKELGVILFGTCKITEGRQVAATGRTIVLALMNYFTAAFLFAFVYTKAGTFTVPANAAGNLSTNQALAQALTVQFSFGPAYPPADSTTWMLVIGQMGFCFLFSLIVISLFVSLLDVGAKEH